MPEALIFVVFPFCMVFAALSDLLSMTIANRVSLLLAGTFVVLAPLTGMDLASIGWHLAAFAVVLLVAFGIFAIGGMGGGDAKLLAATSLWMGFGVPLISYLVTSAFIGGALTLFILFFRSSGLAVLASGNPFLRNLCDPRVGVPYGVALGMGGLLTYPGSPLMAWALERLAAA